jgi:photosystem II stability/assembly factor-like uncharacterized protein
MSNIYYLTPNLHPDGAYSGLTYVFDTSGGFTLDKSLPQATLNASPIAQYDVTDALQLKFNVRTLNNKIGIIKDSSNSSVIEVCYYDSNQDILVNDQGEITDSVTINTTDFLSGLNTSNVVSMGKMSTLYSDFNYTVLEYFGAPQGFSSLFSNTSLFDTNTIIFDASGFINLLNGITFDPSGGSVISDLSGYFTVNNLNSHLRFVCLTDFFDNRPSTDTYNYNITDGFMAGDLIYIPDGISITLTVNIEKEAPNHSNFGSDNLNSINDVINYINPVDNVKKITTSSGTNITQTYSIPILIILENNDHFNFGNYGYVWVDFGTPNGIGNKNWLSVSVSSLGEYQSAVDNQGDIYISSNYGVTWTLSYNIGESYAISIGLSETGRYQTVSNGSNIFISNNYGINWNNVYTLVPNNIFLSVSLCGKYQSIISSGDSLYTSDNYGVNWTRYEDTFSDLYNSIETFPTGGISVSFTGQYQSIACESIYLSNDYGKTWNNAFADLDFEDHNWDGIAISSTGQIQTATDSGGEIYRSQDYGATWQPILSINVLDKNWQAVAMSANAQFQTALENGGSIYITNDTGNTWMVSPDLGVTNKNWQSISVSANGQYQTAVVHGGTIYCSNLL